MKNSNIKFSIGLAIIFYIIAFIGCLCYQLYQKRYLNWFETDAIVIDTWYDYVNGVSDTLDRVDYSEFTYDINGLSYTNKTSGLQHNIGEEVKIYVNPKSYNDSIIIEDIIESSDMWLMIMETVTIVNIIQMSVSIIPPLIKSKKEKK